MSSQIIPVEPFDYVVFGGTGDLAERKLLPALYHRQIDGQLSDPTRVIGASRSTLTDEEYRTFARDALKEHLEKDEYQEAGQDLHRPALLRARRRQVGPGLGQIEGAARRRQGPRAGLLPCRRPGDLRRHFGEDPRPQADHQVDADRRRKADRPRSRLGDSNSTTRSARSSRKSRSSASTTISARRRCRT